MTDGYDVADADYASRFDSSALLDAFDIEGRMLIRAVRASAKSPRRAWCRRDAPVMR